MNDKEEYKSSTDRNNANKNESSQGMAVMSRRKLLASLGVAGLTALTGSVWVNAGASAQAGNRSVADAVYGEQDVKKKQLLLAESLQYVTYTMFGAVLDGLHNDTGAIVAAHQFANAHGYEIRQCGGVAFVDGATAIIWQVNARYSGGFRFKVTHLSGKPFQVLPEYEQYELDQSPFQISEFYKYATRIPSLARYRNHFVGIVALEETDLIRTGGAPQRKRCATVVNEEGDLVYPLITGFNSFSSIRISPINVPRVTIEGFALEVSGAVSRATPVSIQRNRVTFLSPRYIDGGTTQEVPIQSLFSCEFVYDFQLIDPVCDKVGGNRIPYSYMLNYWTSAKILIQGVKSFAGWAQTDGNYTRDVVHRDCVIDRAGGHFACWDFTFDNISTSRSRAIEITGGGRLTIRNLKTTVNDAYEPINILQLRGDYACEWDGEIDMEGVTIDARSITSATQDKMVNVISAITDSSVGTHHFGRQTYLPKCIAMKNITLMLNPVLQKRVTLRALAIGHITAIGSPTVYPEQIVIEHLNIIDSRAEVGHAIKAVELFGGQKMPDQKQSCRLSISGVHNKDPREYGANPATVGMDTVDLKTNDNLLLNVALSDCDWLRMKVAGGDAEVNATGVRFAYLNGDEACRVQAYDCRFASTRMAGHLN
ncbi:hypothetical protein M6D81_12280 [Paenibacillus sp. J5C_2022]|uniref:hypothetical protein n=1 Tax=Paenibacillus sp. J5C2022 TaxID=2977129 RepID=UPI0021D36673|nr:hypothetical protein [Paenibacillus sp. J5C2022]MCU6709481.1 hypothetical protein [Paenibacillus sp. J5C2022]